MNIWTAGKNLMIHHYQIKKYFNKEHTTDEDYLHAQKVWKTFKIKNLGEYHDLYVQSDTSLLADVFETLEISALKYMNLILLIFCLYQD